MGRNKKDNVRQTVLFDIRPRTEDRDVILLKGSAHDASSVLFSGVVVVSVLEPLTVKKFGLKLFATLKLNWEDKHKTMKGTEYLIPMNFNRVLFDFEWDSINLHEFLNQSNYTPIQENFGKMGSASRTTGSSTNITNPTGFTTGKVTTSNKSSATSLTSLNNNNASSTHVSNLNTKQSNTNLVRNKSFTSLGKNKSSSNLSSLNLSAFTSSKSDTVTLQPGNYEFPFQAFLDGSIPESIEGLPGCSLVYRLQSTIERGRFSSALVTKKLVHVVRTLTTDSSELSESVAVDNTWPKKVDYSITVPTRSIAIGARCSIDFTLVPLLKGLRLGSVKVRLVEYSSLAASTSTHLDERVVISKTIPKVTVDSDGVDIWKDSEMDINGVFFRNDSLELAQDKWEVRTFLDIPASLDKVTQDCDIPRYVKVRHKLKFSVGLINPDGHVSELRATLPISLFISPFISIQAKHLDEFDDLFSGKTQNAEDLTVHYKGDEILFDNDHNRSGFVTPARSSDNLTGALSEATSPAPATETFANTQDLMAPPNYENHIYDKLYSEATTASPTNGSPIHSSSQNSSNNVSNAHIAEEFSMTPSESRFASQLISNLSSVNGKNKLSAPSSSTPRASRPIFSLMGDEPTPQSDNGGDLDYFSARTENGQLHSNKPISGPTFETGVRLPPVESSPAIHPALMSPGTRSPVHISRTNSFINATDHNSVLSTPVWEGDVLSRVPSYDTAVKEADHIACEDLTPAYEPDTSNFSPSRSHFVNNNNNNSNGYYSHHTSGINLELLNSRLEKVQVSNSSSPPGSSHILSKSIGGSSMQSIQHQLTSGLARSRGSSANTSPSMSRTHSSANIHVVPRSSVSPNSHSHAPSFTLTQTQETYSGGVNVPMAIQQQQQQQQQSSTNTSSASSISVPRPVHVRTLSSGAVSSARTGNASANGVGSVSLARAASVSSGKLKRPELVSRTSSSLHLHMPKKSGSFANLSFLHKREKTK
ncbi:unnamed protein product [Ambrosiozyma monospora]|uniref:Unnamed protein product n=1 Tax=Ambrosiozyma monospora TaxID=43982 RepID=A0A9W6YSN6_AMBMO|nr:unnamed protein product [Ambrosiozyma monospora]